jgi:hypothetical protein
MTNHTSNTPEGGASRTLTTIHTPNPAQEYGDLPDPALRRYTTHAPAVTHVADPTTGEIVGAQIRTRAYPADLHNVCPNMPTVATTILADDLTFTVEGTARDHTTTIPAGTLVYVVDATAADLAAWKATRTKRYANRADQGLYQIEPRAVVTTPTTAAQSANARKAWTYRAATIDGAAASTTGDGATLTGILARGMARAVGSA